MGVGALGAVKPREPDGLPDVPPDILARAMKAANRVTTLRSAPPGWKPLPEGPFLEESAGAFADRSGRSKKQIYAAILSGFLSGRVRFREQRLRWTVRVTRSGETIGGFMDRLDTSAPPLETVAERRWYDDARVSAGRTGQAVPDHWIESLARLRPFDGDCHDAEITALISCSTAESVRVGQRLESLRSGLSRQTRLEPVEGDVRGALCAALDPDVPELRDTCLDSVTGDETDAPSPELAARLLTVEPGFRSLAIAGMADALAHANLADYDHLPLAYTRIGIILARADLRDGREVRRRLKAYMSGRILARAGRHARHADVIQLLALERRMREWIAERTTPAELKAWLTAHLPAVPRDRGFYAQLKKLKKDLITEGLVGRRRRADGIADNFDGQIVEIGAVTADAKAIWASALVAEKDAVGLDDDKFSAELVARDAGYGDTGETFFLDLRSVRVRHQLALLDAVIHKKGATRFTDSALEGKSRWGDASWLEHRVVVIKRDDLAAAIKERPQLAFLEPYLHGCTLRPKLLPDHMLQDRRDYLTATSMPGPRIAPNDVIVGESADIRKLMTLSLALRDEVIIPVTSLYRGLAIANFNYLLWAVGHVRLSTGRQAIDDLAKGWTELGGRPALLAVPKLPHDLAILPRSRRLRAFPVDDRTMQAFTDAIAITVHVEGGDPMHPKRLRFARVPSSCGMPRGCGDERYVSQFRGRLMNASHIRYCVSFAFGREVQPHDPRHGGATKRYEEGHSLEEVGQAIGTFSHVAKNYVTRGKDAKGAASANRWLRARDGMAQLASARKPG